MSGLTAHGLAGAVLFMAVAGQVQAEPRARVTYERYSVSGTTALGILQELERVGPSVDGVDAYATTESEFRPSGSMQSTGNGCRVKQYRLQMSFKITLPRASNTGAMPAKLRSAWGSFSKFLERHENTHRTIWLGCAADIERKVRALKAGSCETLEQRIAATAQNGIEACRRKHAAFDRAERARLRAQPIIQMALKGH